MSISLKTHKMIWGRSGNMCAFPGCKKVLVIDETATDDPSVIGEEAHIVAQKPDGPRGNSDTPLEQRDKYENLILLCSIHHKIIDDQHQEYTVDNLKHFKITHENWVRDNLLIDKKKVKDDEIYVSYVEKFIELSSLNRWTEWTSWILGFTEIFPKTEFDLFIEIPNYIISRIWPGRHPTLELSFLNFKRVVNDLMSVYYAYPQLRSDGYGIEKFYKQYQRHRVSYDDYSSEEEGKSLDKYNYHVALLLDLVLELTRAGNFVCDQIRDCLFEGFRMKEGALLVMSADIMGHETFRVEYRGDKTALYPGLKQFMIDREARDTHYGEGIEEDYFQKLPWQK